jgi:hypothetical protein
VQEDGKIVELETIRLLRFFRQVELKFLAVDPQCFCSAFILIACGGDTVYRVPKDGMFVELKMLKSGQEFDFDRISLISCFGERKVYVPNQNHKNVIITACN